MKWVTRLSTATALFGLTALSGSAVAQDNLACTPSPVRTVDRVYNPGGWNYNRQLVANAFSLYAAASSDAYEPHEDVKQRRPFAIADDDPKLPALPSRSGVTGWKIVKKGESQKNGLSFDIYHKHEANRLIVLVAYRGTDFWSLSDWIANASWFTQWLNPFDQYRNAAAQFGEIVKAAKEQAKGKSIAYITTGHSLGGGLAQHIAHQFPCVSTVTFNQSFVTRKPILGGYKPLVSVQVYEDKDVFSRFAGRQNNTKTDALYRMNGALGEKIGAQHSMEQLSAAMMRTALDCTKDKNCEAKRSTEAQDLQTAYTLYCRRYLGLRNRPIDPVCARNAPALKQDGAFTSDKIVTHD